MSKVTIFAASVAGLTWATTTLDFAIVPPELITVNRFEVSSAGDLVMDRTVNPGVVLGEQAVLSITIEGPDDGFVCSGQRLINLRVDENPVKRWQVNDWFDRACKLPIPPGSIMHGTWVPVDRDGWSITSARWKVPPDAPL